MRVCVCARVHGHGADAAAAPRAHRWFDRLVIAVILLNCVCLAAVDPLDADNSSTRNQVRDMAATAAGRACTRAHVHAGRGRGPEWCACLQVLEVADLVFLVLYSVEMVLKIGATGLVIGPGTYLRQGWNVIDGALVVSAWCAYLPFTGDASLSSIRIVRMLRPLRTVQSVPGLRVRGLRLVAARVATLTLAHLVPPPVARELDACLHPATSQRGAPLRLHVRVLRHQWYAPQHATQAAAWRFDRC